MLTNIADSENAKAMMPVYHIGTLDETSRAILAKDTEVGFESATEPRPIFLQSRMWSKATLSAKEKVSSDSKIFTFTLDHTSQTIGLPVGQHLMMRIRDPASGEAIIRAYTPVSEGNETGRLCVLVKIYYDTPQNKGGRMTQALDSLPLGQLVDFKGPVGKFEYLGGGRCTINRRERCIRRFVMVCAGSGITPIFQVLRAVMKDKEDPTSCLVLDGNRVEEDILLKQELDAMALDNPSRCRLLYALSRPLSSWQGLRGRMDRALFEKEVGGPPKANDAIVLVCGPTPMEDAVKCIFRGMGWEEEDLLFF